jgi:geranylgeranyl pyrophosphate synthase
VMSAVTAVSRSQLEEYHFRGAQNFEESAYLDVVEGKTAALLAACCAGGAAIAGAGDAVVDALHDYGRNLGIAFQIVDDVLDFSQTSGKVIAQDLRQSIGSLPLVYAMRDPEASAWIHARLDSGQGFDADEAAAVVRASGALDQASRRAEDYRDLAVAALAPVKDGPDRARLRELADYTVARQA